MRLALLLCIIVLLLSIVIEASTCPAGGGIICYPNDCSEYFQRCDGINIYAPEPTPKGLVCREGLLVFPSACSLAKCPEISSCSLSQIFSEEDFVRLFPYFNGGAINGRENQHAIFNYSKLILAAQKFPAFGCTGSAEMRKRELAAFLAQTSQETSGWWAGQPYNWGYYFSTEIGCTNDNTACHYCDPAVTEYPCDEGKGYFGRGPIQLSWNYNYGQLSKALFGDKNILLSNPDLIFSGNTAFESALWFWMTPQAPKPSCHQIMVGEWTPTQDDIAHGRLPGFGETINIINGGLECSIETQQRTENRVQYFKEYARQFGVTTGPNLYCNETSHY